MHGLPWHDPYRIRSDRELIAWINEIGFLPLFANEIEGFSAEEHVSPDFWWTGDPEQDPWLWRERIARSEEVAYGKFFNKKSGFISKAWFPVFANYRRNGYDFDALWDDEQASIRSKKIMDCFEEQPEYIGLELKRKAGFGKEGEKNFPSILTDLQMRTYLVIRDFRRKVNKKGSEYGMPVSVYAKPEELWGYDLVTSAYPSPPQQCKAQIFAQTRRLYPHATEKQLEKLLK